VVDKSRLASIVGKGWKFPFQFSGTGGVATAGGGDDADSVEKVRQSLRQIIGTYIGERVMRRDFGSFLHRLVGEPNDSFLESRLRQFVNEAILLYEKRIILTDLQIINDNPLSGKIEMNIVFAIARTRQQGNLVYPLYLEDVVNG